MEGGRTNAIDKARTTGTRPTTKKAVIAIDTYIDLVNCMCVNSLFSRTSVRIAAQKPIGERKIT
jgi:hypothetical protein